MKHAIWLGFFLIGFPSHAMMQSWRPVKQSTAPQVNLEGSQTWLSSSLDSSLAYFEVDAKLKSRMHELHLDYNQLLGHVTRRVDELEEQLKSQKESEESSWFSYISSAWVLTKAYTRSVELLVKDPESKKLSQNIIEKLMLTKAYRKNYDMKFFIEPDLANKKAVELLQQTIDSLLDQYGREESRAMKTHLIYLREYKDRINRVEREFMKMYDRAWVPPVTK